MFYNTRDKDLKVRIRSENEGTDAQNERLFESSFWDDNRKQEKNFENTDKKLCPVVTQKCIAWLDNSFVDVQHKTEHLLPTQ